MQKASPPFTETTLQPQLGSSTGVTTAWDKTCFGELVTKAQTLEAGELNTLEKKAEQKGICPKGTENWLALRGTRGLSS